MEFLEVIRSRRSVRAYQAKPVEEDKLRRILACATAAPSAGNLQAYGIVVVTDGPTRRALARAALDQAFIAQAPVVLVFFQDPGRSALKYGRRGAELYSLQDATIACAYAQLAATALGLGSCWVGAFDEAEVCRLLKAPVGWRPVALLPIGYPAEVPLPVGRRPLAEVVRWESFETLPDQGFGSRMGRGIMPLDTSQGVLRCSLRRSLREGGTGPALPE
jgi:nitroreductase